MEGVDEIMRNRVKRQARIVRVRRLKDHNISGAQLRAHHISSLKGGSGALER